MNNDTHTEQRRQWVNDQQEYTMEDVDYQLQFDPQTIKNEAKGTAYLQEMMFDDDHTEALKTNQLFDTLQAILDQAEEPRADLRAEYDDLGHIPVNYEDCDRNFNYATGEVEHW